MKRRDLDRKLRNAGYVIYDDNPHDKAVHPDKPNHRIPLPKHREIDERLARKILDEAGVT